MAQFVGYNFAVEHLWKGQPQDRVTVKRNTYWGDGFHEDGLLSGVNVARALGREPSWA